MAAFVQQESSSVRIAKLGEVLQNVQLTELTVEFLNCATN